MTVVVVGRAIPMRVICRQPPGVCLHIGAVGIARCPHDRCTPPHHSSPFYNQQIYDAEKELEAAAGRCSALSKTLLQKSKAVADEVRPIAGFACMMDGMRAHAQAPPDPNQPMEIGEIEGVTDTATPEEFARLANTQPPKHVFSNADIASALQIAGMPSGSAAPGTYPGEGTAFVPPFTSTFAQTPIIQSAGPSRTFAQQQQPQQPAPLSLGFNAESQPQTQVQPPAPAHPPKGSKASGKQKRKVCPQEAKTSNGLTVSCTYDNAEGVNHHINHVRAAYHIPIMCTIQPLFAYSSTVLGAGQECPHRDDMADC